jgi:glycosyltransferase involved in cell wall biosynthesis
MKCLHVTPAFYPATYYGGPIHSVHGLCNALATIPDVDLRVLTTDTAGPAPRDRLPVAGFPTRYTAGYDVYFCRRIWAVDVAPGMLFRLWLMVSWADIVHITGVYSFPTIPALFACRILGKPVVWSPRGALQRWERASRPALKQAWELVCRALIDNRKCVLHATAEPEAEDSTRRIPGVATVVIPNGVDVPGFQARSSWPKGGPLRLLFIGRLHPIKGIENLLHAIAATEPGAVSLTLCGDGEPAYSQGLRALAAELGLGDAVRFAGHVEGEAKLRAFGDSDLCVVPSHSENFGMVVAEALASGVPVVASTGTPWAGLEQHGCGLWVSNEPASLAAAIMSLRDRDLAAMGAAGRAWMEAEYGWVAIGHRMGEVYSELLKRG